MNLQKFLTGKVVVVTGSARGIGRETARIALSAGARVVINGRSLAAVEETRFTLGFPDRTLAVAADVSIPGGAELLVSRTLATWGRIDLLINNAGLSMRGAFSELSFETIRTMVDSNLLTAVLTTKAALTALRESRGRVVFVSSLAGVRGFPGVSLYSASKMALEAVHQALWAEESGRGITTRIVYLPFTENDPGKTVLGADGKPFRHDRQWSSTQKSAARSLLSAAAGKQKKTVLTPAGKFLVWAHAWVPGLVGWAVGRSGGKLHSIRRQSGS